MTAVARISALIFAVPLLFSGCMTGRLVFEGGGSPAGPCVAVDGMGFDEYGRPAFGPPLKKRPSREGDRFVVGRYEGDRPLVAYDLAVTGAEEPDVARPLWVVYEWTGRGFMAGARLSGHMLQALGNLQPASDEEAAVIILTALSPVVLGSAGGFVVGVVASVPQAARELRQAVISKEETLVSYTVFEYDGAGRISAYSTYAAGMSPSEIVRAGFFYKGASSVPARADVTSRPEGTVRTIRPE
jgi:hypothetical protein